MDGRYPKATSWKRWSDDPYHEAICRERSWEQQRLSGRIMVDEASWADLERRSSDRMIYRWYGQALLRLRHSLLAFHGAVRSYLIDCRRTWQSISPAHKHS